MSKPKKKFNLKNYEVYKSIRKEMPKPTSVMKDKREKREDKEWKKKLRDGEIN